MGFIRIDLCDYSGWGVQQQVVCSRRCWNVVYIDENFKRLRWLFDEWYNPYLKVESLRTQIGVHDILESRTEDKCTPNLRRGGKSGGGEDSLTVFLLYRFLSRRWSQETPRIALPNGSMYPHSTTSTGNTSIDIQK